MKNLTLVSLIIAAPRLVHDLEQSQSWIEPYSFWIYLALVCFGIWGLAQKSGPAVNPEAEMIALERRKALLQWADAHGELIGFLGFCLLLAISILAGMLIYHSHVP